jgi:uncharacterized protein YndB with AHSA1/START domain
MNVSATQPPGDQARVSVQVAVEPEAAFRIFTDEIDAWWRRGRKYRVAGSGAGTLRLEPGVGGRLSESFERNGELRTFEIGRVTAWDPPLRLVLDWRAVNFAEDEKTEVEVTFQPQSSGTLVTVTHRGWSDIRPGHPARHQLETGPFLRMLGMWWSDLLTSLRVQVK